MLSIIWYSFSNLIFLFEIEIFIFNLKVSSVCFKIVDYKEMR